jgi:hypothetical protein
VVIGVIGPSSTDHSGKTRRLLPASQWPRQLRAPRVIVQLNARCRHNIRPLRNPLPLRSPFLELAAAGLPLSPTVEIDLPKELR